MGGKLKSREDVIKDFKEIWGDFYDYSEMEYLPHGMNRYLGMFPASWFAVVQQ